MLGFRPRLRALSHSAAILKDRFWRKAATHTASRSMAHHPLSLDLRLTRPPRRYPKRNGLMIAGDNRRLDVLQCKEKTDLRSFRRDFSKLAPQLWCLTA